MRVALLMRVAEGKGNCNCTVCVCQVTRDSCVAPFQHEHACTAKTAADGPIVKRRRGVLSVNIIIDLFASLS